MRRVLRRAVGVLAAIGVLGLARPVLAQTSPYQPQSPWMTARKVPYGENLTFSEGRIRLEEFKVELALLSDVATFPYYLDARASTENLELRGYVPNAMVRQRALELARRHTSLNVIDRLQILTNLNLRQRSRDAAVLQEEAVALLVKNLGAFARRFHVEARPNGLVTVTGPIDSLEGKLTISGLFRQLPGCCAVINQLTVQPVLRDGQKVVQVTKDGSRTVPVSVLTDDPELGLAAPVVTARTPIAPEPLPGISRSVPLSPKEIPSLPAATTQPALALTTVTPPSSLDAREEELRLPPLALPTAPSSQPVAITETPRKVATTGHVTQAPVKPAKKSKPVEFASETPSIPSEGGPKTNSVDVLTAPKLPTSWARPAIVWESETKASPATTVPAPMPSVTPKTLAVLDTPAAAVSMDTGRSETSAGRATVPAMPAPAYSARHWPPAYDVRPPAPEKEHPTATIVEEVPAPTLPVHTSTTGVIRPVVPPVHTSTTGVIRPVVPPVHTSTTGVIRPVVPADLKRQVVAICGKQAQDVEVEVQRDASVMIKVKVPSIAVEQQLTSKILTLPEMVSPNVRLTVEVSP